MKLASLAALALSASCLVLSTSCGDSARRGWTVEGMVDGAENGTRLAVEGFNNGNWYVLDSVEVHRGGYFSYEAEAPAAYPEIMRLTYPGRGSIYFPVDGRDEISIEARADAYTSSYRLSGSPAALKIAAVDSIVNAAAARMGGKAAAADSLLKRELVGYITSDTTAVVAYYVINKAIGDVPVFDPKDEFDNRIYGAAAQIFKTHRPDDLRGAVLANVFIEGRRALGKLAPAAPETTIEVPESGLIDIVRFDNRGTRHSLAELASEGKVVILSFSAYDIQASPAYNLILNEIYERYHDSGLEIYQIAFDADEAMWKQTAVNLPWITVWNSPTDGPGVLASYNVGALPLTYIIGRDGAIASREPDPTALQAAVAKHF